MFIRNQKVKIVQTGAEFAVTALQNTSTPGILFKYYVVPNIKYLIKIKFNVISNCNVKFWIGDNKKQNILLHDDKFISKNPIEYIYENIIYDFIYIGILFNNFKKNDKFILESIEVKPIFDTPINVDILILTYNDWANTAQRFKKSLESIGLDVYLYKSVKHIFNYPDQAPVLKSLRIDKKNNHPIILNAKNDPYLKYMMKHAKVINFHASSIVNYENLNLNNKHIVLTVSGHTYRILPKKVLDEFIKFPKFEYTIVQCPDLLNLGSKNEHLIYYPVDIDYIRPNFNFKYDDKLSIGHFSTNPITKGTQNILNAIKMIETDNIFCNKIKYIGITEVSTRHFMDWDKSLTRFKDCDIYIETCNLKLNYGAVFGEWGNTCLEAAASGCIVITNSLTRDYYLKEYGNYPLIIANSSKEIYNELKKLCVMSREEILKLKHTFREWVVNTHSFKPTGERLWKKVYKNLLDKKL